MSSISCSCFGAFFTRLSYCSGVSSGNLRTKATTSQSSSSSWVTPQAGIPVGHVERNAHTGALLSGLIGIASHAGVNLAELDASATQV